MASESSDEIGADEFEEISLFEFVVIIRRLLSCGRRADSCEVRSDIGVDAGDGRERVGGRLSPGKDVKRTVIVLDAILRDKEPNVSMSSIIFRER